MFVIHLIYKLLQRTTDRKGAVRKRRVINQGEGDLQFENR